MANFKVNIEQLNKRITLEKYTPYDEDGITKNKWLPYKTVWCDVNNLFGEEFWKAKECGYENIVMFGIRYSKDMSNINSREYRINWNNRLYNIISIDNIKYSNTFIKIKAKEVEI